MEIEGEVKEGLGKGEFYMSKEAYQNAFNEKIGFRPFPGTLNLKVSEKDRKEFENNTETLKISNVRDNGKRLSNIDLSPCSIDGVECALLNLEITDHPYSIAEVVAPVKLRDKFNLENGDEVVLKMKENQNIE